jgi:hypothetical protein
VRTLNQIAMTEQLPQFNPDFVYIKSDYVQKEHGFQPGEEVRPVWRQIETRDNNGLDIWVYSKHSRNARPVHLIPEEYSLTPLAVREG